MVVPLPPVDTIPVEIRLTDFTLVTPAEVVKLIEQSPARSCSRDPMPTFLVKEHASTLSPAIANLVNLSLQLGHLSRELKQAVVNPLLITGQTHPEALYTCLQSPLCLQTCGEDIVVKQLSKKLLDNDLYEPFQSAYRTGHSTEKALTRVSNDMIHALDSKCSLCCSIYMSAAFDTVDHGLPLGMLENRYGIIGEALRMFTSDLPDKTQRVVIYGVKSVPQPPELGVSQGVCPQAIAVQALLCHGWDNYVRAWPFSASLCR